MAGAIGVPGYSGAWREIRYLVIAESIRHPRVAYEEHKLLRELRA